MAKYIAVAFPESGLPKKSAVVEAKNKEEALAQAWRLFPEYHEIGVWEA